MRFLLSERMWVDVLVASHKTSEASPTNTHSQDPRLTERQCHANIPLFCTQNIIVLLIETFEKTRTF